jgi:regulator of sigma E protease
MFLTVILGVLVLGILVFVHELGHFLVAKRNHIVVEEFGLGYPPRLVKLGERDGTEYTLNAIPFGGFCRMRGEDDPSLQGSFASASRGARAATLFAGAGMNFLLAIVLFSVVALMLGEPDPTRPGTVIEAVAPGSPAQQAGLQPGDRIIAAHGMAINTPEDLQKDTPAHAGKPVTYQVVRTDPKTGASQTIEVTLVPRANPPANQGALGIAIGTAMRPIAPWSAVWSGLQQTGGVIYMTFSVPAMLIREGKPLSDAGFMGPVGITVVAGEFVRSAANASALAPILRFVALLSAALGITQLLPIPALDGGRLLFILVEVIRRKRVEPAQEGIIHLVGFGLLLALVGLMTIHEISSLVTGTFPSLGIP